jgi:PBP1b-binding outer membrane lipoprotein LpoB
MRTQPAIMETIMRIATIGLVTTLATLAACGPQATYKDSRGNDLVVSLDQPNIQDFNQAADKMVQSMMVSGVLNNAPRKPAVGPLALQSLERLGLEEGADAETIKTRFKSLVKQLHPDVNGGDRATEDQLREIIDAYNTLKASGLA